MTLQEKIAALPPMPQLPRIGIVDGAVHSARLLIALHARNDLLCEVLHQYVDDYENDDGMAEAKRYARNFRAVLEACEAQP